MLRILVIAPIYPTFDRPGKGRFIKTFVDSLNALPDCEVTVVRVTSSMLVSFKRENEDCFKLSVLPNVFRIKRFQKVSILLNKAFIRKLLSRTIKRKVSADIIYSHFFVGGALGIEFSKIMQIPHILGVGENEQYLKDIKEQILGKRSTLEILKESKKVICVSPLIFENLLADFGHALKDKMKVLPNGINQALFDSKSEEYYSTIFTKKRIKRIAFVGHFDRRKGVERLLEAAECIENVELFLMGKGKLLSSSVIGFQGEVSHSRLVDILKSSDLFVLPTLAEGWCNALNEAMACGLPIITSDIPSVQVQMQNVNHIKINPNSIIDIRNAIEYALANSELMAKMAESSKSFAQTLSIESRAKRFISFALD